jgi:hypothetical protein
MYCSPARVLVKDYFLTFFLKAGQVAFGRRKEEGLPKPFSDLRTALEVQVGQKRVVFQLVSFSQNLEM